MLLWNKSAFGSEKDLRNPSILPRLFPFRSAAHPQSTSVTEKSPFVLLLSTAAASSLTWTRSLCVVQDKWRFLWKIPCRSQINRIYLRGGDGGR